MTSWSYESRQQPSGLSTAPGPACLGLWAWASSHTWWGSGEEPQVRQEAGGVGGHLIMVPISNPHKWRSREFLAGEPAQAKACARGLKLRRILGLNHVDPGAPGSFRMLGAGRGEEVS